jgi:predicted small metal-binding protein
LAFRAEYVPMEGYLVVDGRVTRCPRAFGGRMVDRGGLVWRLVMTLRIICMCGYFIQGADDDELWQNAQDHMRVLHSELVGNVTREDILAQAEQL